MKHFNLLTVIVPKKESVCALQQLSLIVMVYITVRFERQDTDHDVTYTDTWKKKIMASLAPQY